MNIINAVDRSTVYEGTTKMVATTRLSSDDHDQVDSCSRVDSSHLRVKGAKGYQSASVLSRLFWL